MTAQIVRHESSTSPGGTITYSIWVWSTVAAQKVTAHASSSVSAMRSPLFTLCPATHNETCTLGSLPADQAFEVVITDQVRTTAIAGHQVSLTVTVQGTGLSPANATITTLLSQPSSSPTPPPGAGTTLPPSSFPSYPTTTVSPGSLSSLFPVVTPSPSATHSPSHHPRRLVGVTSSALPLDPRLIGGQLAALAVLAAAITMVMARLSLRTPHPAGPGPAPSAGTATVTAPTDSVTQASTADPAPVAAAPPAKDPLKPTT